MPAENEGGVLCRLIQRNKLEKGCTAELLTPGKVGIPFAVSELYGEDGAPIESTPHPLMTFYTRLPHEAAPGDIVRAGESEGRDGGEGREGGAF